MQKNLLSTFCFCSEKN